MINIFSEDSKAKYYEDPIEFINYEFEGVPYNDLLGALNLVLHVSDIERVLEEE